MRSGWKAIVHVGDLNEVPESWLQWLSLAFVQVKHWMKDTSLCPSLFSLSLCLLNKEILQIHIHTPIYKKGNLWQLGKEQRIL